MRKEITKEDIRTNLKNEYGIKPVRRGTIMIVAGIVFCVLCLSTGRLLGILMGILVLAVGISEKIKAKKKRRRLETQELIIREGRCIKKKIRTGADGTKRYFCFTKDEYYIAGDQDIKLWEKTNVGDKFYLVSFQGTKEIEKIYPQSAVQLVNK